MACLLSFILIIYTQIKICASNTINTDIDSEYKDDIITCNTGEDCIVICDEDESCYNTNIYCPSGYSCDIQCISSHNRPPVDPLISNVCAESTIHCTDSTQCNINCTDVNPMSLSGFACADATFNWPSNKQYNLYCGSGTSCKGITVDPKYNNEPFVWNCENDGACKSMTFNCPTDSTCDITCNDMESCRSFTLNCDTTGTYPCSVSCSGYHVCYDGVINGIGTVIACSYVGACVRLTFPDPPSGVDYTLECALKESCTEAVIKCPTDAECHITCTGTDSCANAQIIWPTNDAYATSLTCLDNDACLNVEKPPTIDSISADPTSSTVVPVDRTSNPSFIPTLDPKSYLTSSVDLTSKPTSDPTFIITRTVDPSSNTIFIQTVHHASDPTFTETVDHTVLNQTFMSPTMPNTHWMSSRDIFISVATQVIIVVVCVCLCQLCCFASYVLYHLWTQKKGNVKQIVIKTDGNSVKKVVNVSVQQMGIGGNNEGHMMSGENVETNIHHVFDDEDDEEIVDDIVTRGLEDGTMLKEDEFEVIGDIVTRRLEDGTMHMLKQDEFEVIGDIAVSSQDKFITAGP